MLFDFRKTKLCCNRLETPLIGAVKRYNYYQDTHKRETNFIQETC